MLLNLPIKKDGFELDLWDENHLDAFKRLKIDNGKAIGNYRDRIDLMIQKDCLILGSFVIKLKYLDENIVEIGYVIDENYRNQGYATKVLAIVVAYFSQHHKKLKLVATVEDRNTRSKRVLEKNGFEEYNRIDIHGGAYLYYEYGLRGKNVKD